MRGSAQEGSEGKAALGRCLKCFVALECKIAEMQGAGDKGVSRCGSFLNTL